MKWKRSFSLVGISTLLLLPSVSGAETISYKDVPKGNSHYEAIMELTEMGVINGYTLEDGTKEFKPNQKIRRDQSAKMFVKALDLTIPENVSDILKDIVDVGESHYYAKEISASIVANVFKGNKNGEYMPSSPLTREQMATVIVRAFDIPEADNHKNIKLSNVDPSHKANVQILADYGITNQLEDFRPKEAVTRGQFASFLKRTMDVIAELENGEKPKEPENPNEDKPDENDKDLEIRAFIFNIDDLYVGDKVLIELEALYEDNSRENITSETNFEIEDTSIAELENGNIVAKKVGSTALTATYKDYSVETMIRVLANEEDETDDEGYEIDPNELIVFDYTFGFSRSAMTHEEQGQKMIKREMEEAGIHLTFEDVIKGAEIAIENAGETIVYKNVKFYYDKSRDGIDVTFKKVIDPKDLMN